MDEKGWPGRIPLGREALGRPCGPRSFRAGRWAWGGGGEDPSLRSTAGFGKQWAPQKKRPHGTRALAGDHCLLAEPMGPSLIVLWPTHSPKEPERMVQVGVSDFGGKRGVIH